MRPIILIELKSEPREPLYFEHTQKFRSGKVVLEESQKMSQKPVEKNRLLRGKYFLCYHNLRVAAKTRELFTTRYLHWTQIISDVGDKFSRKVRKMKRTVKNSTFDYTEDHNFLF